MTKDAGLTRVKDIGLSARALEAIVAAAPHLNGSPSVRKVTEELTRARLLEMPGVGESTVAEIEEAMQRDCGCTLGDSRNAGKKAKASAPAESTPDVLARSRRDTATKKKTTGKAKR